MKYKLIIFDFDGTLADSFPWFIKMMNVPLYKLPIISTFMRNMMTENIEDIKLISGIEELMHKLKETGYKLAVVSTNSKTNIIKVLGEELFALNDHFVAGVSLFGKESKIKKVLKLSGIDKKDAIYIGDELRDIQASKKVGLACGAVTWGVNDADSLAALSPDELYYDVEQILKSV